MPYFAVGGSVNDSSTTHVCLNVGEDNTNTEMLPAPSSRPSRLPRATALPTPCLAGKVARCLTAQTPCR